MTYTGEWFKKYRYYDATFVLSPGDDAVLYQEITGCPCVVSESFNLGSKRQWAVDTFTSKESPWLLFFEDNIQRVTMVLDEYYDKPRIDPTTREIYHSQEVGPQRVIQRMLEDIKLASDLNAFFGGYACNDNHYFRKVKYRTIAFVWTKIGYVRRGGPKWPDYVNEMDDYAMTAECLLHSGKVLVNNYIYPWAKRYEGRGGSRTQEERVDDKRATVKELMRRFPGLFRIHNKPTAPADTEILLTMRSESKLNEWREMLWEQDEG